MTTHTQNNRWLGLDSVKICEQIRVPSYHTDAVPPGRAAAAIILES